MAHAVVNVITGEKSNRPPLAPGRDISSKDVPPEVTMRQARLALLNAGLLSAVETAIDALPEPPRTAARIEWDHSNTVQRNNAFVLQLGGLLGLTPQQLDSLFIAAAQL
jgi:hypothetical protein